MKVREKTMTLSEKIMNFEVLRTTPAVYCVRDTYHIMVPVKMKCTMWVRVGDEEYFDESNGILKSNVTLHRMIVPAKELNREKKYTICFRREFDRKPYFSKMGEVEEILFDFNPVECDGVRAYHISDAHNLVQTPIKAARTFEKERGRIDFLILNGDIPDSSGNFENFDNIYDIISELTGGNIPVVFSRGNHDMRGAVAENFAEYTPCHNGNSYYTFRLGNIWGMIIDCGEDKIDEHIEYGNTICCHTFRKRQTEFIKSVIADKRNEYMADGVEKKIIVCHAPFTMQMSNEVFMIEQDIYRVWSELIEENIKPDVMICGHMHETKVIYPGDERDILGQSCPIVLAGVPTVFEEPDDRCYYIGAGYTFNKDEIEVLFTNNKNEIISESVIEL